MRDSKGQRINSLQGLRAILFVLIFTFHTSMIGNISESLIYINFFKGGGAEAVAFFFVLSGFIEALHQRNEVPDIKNITRLCIAKVKKFYGLHVFFLLAVTPTVIISVVKAPLQAGGRMIINLLLLQSWFPDEQIWLSYNSVTWFISTLAFLFLFIIPMHWISNHLEQKWPTGRFYCGLLVIIWLLDFLLAILLLKKDVSNIKYYLYAFPPSRMFDYASGFILGRFFICHKKYEISEKKATFLEIISVNIIIGYLLIFPYISDYFSRSIMYLPGAALVIYVFAIGKGKISGFFSSPLMVAAGNNSLYYMMSHQVVIRYCSLIHKNLLRFNIRSSELIWVFVAFVVTFASKPIYDMLCFKLRRLPLDWKSMNHQT